MRHRSAARDTEHVTAVARRAKPPAPAGGILALQRHADRRTTDRGLTRPLSPTTAHDVFALQRAVGNRATVAVLQRDDYASERSNPGDTSRYCAAPTYAPFQLFFDGRHLSMSGSGVDRSWDAVSGRPHAGNFDYSPAAERARGEGPIPQGSYWIDPRQLVDLEDRWFYGLLYEKAWGTDRITIHPYPETETYGRGGFFIHGGTEPGSAGCIDLTTQMRSFANQLKTSTPGGAFVKLTVRYQ